MQIYHTFKIKAITLLPHSRTPSAQSFTLWKILKIGFFSRRSCSHFMTGKTQLILVFLQIPSVNAFAIIRVRLPVSCRRKGEYNGIKKQPAPAKEATHRRRDWLKNHLYHQHRVVPTPYEHASNILIKTATTMKKDDYTKDCRIIISWHVKFNKLYYYYYRGVCFYEGR